MKPRPRYEAPQYRPAAKLQGRVALITGGDSGIGRAVALLFAKEGADIAFVHLGAERQDAAETVAVVEREGRRALAIVADLTQPFAAESTVEQVITEFGRLDILVNNAAYQRHQESIGAISDMQWEQTFGTNITSYFRMARAAIPHLPRGGAIVNTGSITGLEGSEHLLDYSATKGAIHAFTKSLAKNLVGQGIRVNCVAPGPVWTPLNVADKPARKAGRHGAETPMGRPAQPEEVAPAFVFFASEVDSGYITGEILTLLGGETTAA